MKGRPRTKRRLRVRTGFALAVLAPLSLALACRITAVSHVANISAGNNFTADLDLDGVGAPLGDTGTFYVCVGLNDPDARGWDGTEMGWSITSGTGSPASGSGTLAAAHATSLNGSDPGYAPWRCWNSTVGGATLDSTSVGSAAIEVTVPNCAKVGAHALRWYSNDGPNIISGTLVNPQTFNTSITVTDRQPDITATEPEPPGALCRNGGIKISHGCDGDADGIPDVDVQVGYACVDAPDGHTSLLVKSDEPKGANCPGGGQKLEVGVDNGDGGGTPDNGVLEAGEVDQTAYACDGTPGTDGVDGTNGVNGSNGSNGTDGTDGEDGAKGDAGAPGPDGVDGVNGSDGMDGVDGLNGSDGMNGADGLDGLDGADGMNGSDGADGPAGENGDEGTGCAFAPGAGVKGEMPAVPLLLLCVGLMLRRRRASS